MTNQKKKYVGVKKGKRRQNPTKKKQVSLACWAYVPNFERAPVFVSSRPLTCFLNGPFVWVNSQLLLRCISVASVMIYFSCFCLLSLSEKKNIKIKLLMIYYSMMHHFAISFIPFLYTFKILCRQNSINSRRQN